MAEVQGNDDLNKTLGITPKTTPGLKVGEALAQRGVTPVRVSDAGDKGVMTFVRNDGTEFTIEKPWAYLAAVVGAIGGYKAK